MKEKYRFDDYTPKYKQLFINEKKYEEVKKEAIRLAQNDGEKYRNHKKKYIEDVTRRALRQSAKLY